MLTASPTKHPECHLLQSPTI